MSGTYKKMPRKYGASTSGRRRKVRRSESELESSFGRKGPGNRKVRVFRAWMTLVTTVTLTAFAAFHFIKSRFFDASPITAPSNKTVAALGPDDFISKAEPIVWKGPQPNDVANRFMAATTHEERLKWIRDPEQDGPLMEEFFLNGPGKDEVPLWQSPDPEPKLDEGVLFIQNVQMRNGAIRNVCIPFDDAGVAKVDFRAYARYCSDSWEAVMSGKLERAGEMRVILSPDHYYNREFADDEQWISFVADSPEMEASIFLYARRNDPALAEFLRNPLVRSQRFTISIARSGESHKNKQFILANVIRAGWNGR